MKTTIYLKKEIKSEADLPKVDDLYFVHSKNSGKQTKFSFHENAHVWMKNIDWYLQPIELDLPDDEEIVKQFPYAYDDLDIQISIQWLRHKIKDQLK